LEPNPRESVNVITLRSGKRYDGPTMLELVTDEVVIEDNQIPIQEKEAPIKEGTEKKKGKFQAKPVASKAPMEPYKPKIPFPQRLKQNISDLQFANFLELLKQLKINIPFVEAIAQMPKYVKVLKEIMDNKKQIVEFEIIALNEECSAIVLKNLPPKLKDLGSFTIPHTIGELNLKEPYVTWG